MKTKLQVISDLLTNVVTGSDSVALWNSVCEYRNNPDDMIYSMADFEELCGEMAQNDLLSFCRRIQLGDFCVTDEWFWFNTYGYLCSSDYPIDDSKSPVYVGEILDYLEAEGDENETFDANDLLKAFLKSYFPANDAAAEALTNLVDNGDCDLIREDWDIIRDALKNIMNA